MNDDLQQMCERQRAEINRRRGEMSVAREALSDAGIPSTRDGITLTMSQRINILANDRELAANHLSDVWIHLDSWARGEAPSLEFVQDACKSILKHQQAPGWKDA